MKPPPRSETVIKESPLRHEVHCHPDSPAEALPSPAMLLPRFVDHLRPSALKCWKDACMLRSTSSKEGQGSSPRNSVSTDIGPS